MKRRILAVVLTATMVMGMSIGASAAQHEPAEAPRYLEGQGYIAAEDEHTDKDEDKNGPDTEGMIDISIPANGFLWYANESTYDSANYNYGIKSAAYNITNNSKQINVEVTLVEYEKSSEMGAIDEIGTNGVKLTDVQVALSGDLATTAATDLVNNGSSINYTYPTFLGADGNNSGYASTWTYGFTGVYDNSTLPSASQTTDYVLVLQFEAVSSEGQ